MPSFPFEMNFQKRANYRFDNLCGRRVGSTRSQAGAQAYMLKSDVRKDLPDTIRSVHAGKRRIHSEVAAQLADHVADDVLTPREIEVLALIALGNSNKLIADKLSIADETVKGHVSSVLSKLGAHDRTHAVTLD
jgi:DNA-binding NarL/FixJ family response regulator